MKKMTPGTFILGMMHITIYTALIWWGIYWKEWFVVGAVAFILALTLGAACTSMNRE